MPGTAHLPLARRQQQTLKACRANPPLSQRRANGGLRWAEKYRTLSPLERQRIAVRVVIGRYIWDAKRRGLPIPIFHTYTPERGPDGKLQAKPGSMRPMSEEDLATL
jgi:hypothetical protein